LNALEFIPFWVYNNAACTNPLYIRDRVKMKKKIMIGFIILFTLYGCTAQPTVVPLPVVTQLFYRLVQPTKEKTRDYYAVKTIIAREQFTRTPSPTQIPETATSRIEAYVTVNPIISATVAKSLTPIYNKPGSNNKTACYVDKGIQLFVVSQNLDSSWLNVKFSQGQTCYRVDVNSNRTDIVPDPAMEFWILNSMVNISGDPSAIPTITSSP
jgi:hypothetical protein